MTDGGSGLPPAGWFPDPTGGVPGQKRWWDGGQWTAHVETPPVAPPPPSAPAPPAYTPMGGYTSAVTGDPRNDFIIRNIPSHTSTLPGLIISITPLPQLAIVAVFLFIGNLVGFAGLAAVGVVVASILTVVLAAQDRAGLRLIGFQNPAHWAWMLIGPFWYLLFRYLRTKAEAGIGIAPLVRYFVTASVTSIALSGIVALVAPTAIEGAKPPLTPTTSAAPLPPGVPDYAKIVAREIESDALGEDGIIYEVSCPGPIAEIGQNRVIDCVVLNTADKRVGSTRVTMSDNADGTTSSYDYTPFDFDH